MADNGSKASGIIGQILAYIDRPWKAFVVVGLLIIGGVGYAAYQKREEIIEAFLTPSEVGLKTHDIPEALDKLAEESGADLVQIWSVDMPSNSQTFIAARRKDKGRPVIPSPRRLPILVTVSDVRSLVDILEGHPVCVTVTLAGSPLARRLAERGMKYGCAIPIPPGPTTFVGVIYLAWEEPPDPSIESVAVGNARQIAGNLVTR
jgi:hypothetical protein